MNCTPTESGVDEVDATLQQVRRTVPVPRRCCLAKVFETDCSDRQKR